MAGMERRRDEWMNGWMDGMERRRDEWTDEWMDGRMNGWMELIFDGGVDGCLGEKWRTTWYEVFGFSTAATNTWFVFLCAMFDFWIAVPMWPHSANSRLC